MGTLNSLYSQDAAAAGDEEAAAEPFDFLGGVGEALATIPANLAGLPQSLLDPFGVSVVGGSSEDVAEEVGASTTVYAGLRNGFTQGQPQVYAYLLFVLLYLPCVAAFGAMTKEMGLRYTMLALAHLAVTAWSVATLFYQVAVGRNPLWIGVALALLVVMGFVFWAIGRSSKSLGMQQLRPVEEPAAAR